MDIERLATFVVGICIGLLALFFQRRVKAWSHPAVAFAGFWAAMTLLPLLVAPQLVPSPYAFAFILAAVAAFGFPLFFMKWEFAVAGAIARQTNPTTIFQSRAFLVVFLLLQATPMVCILVNLQKQGFSLSDLTSPLTLNCKYLAARYSGQITSNSFSFVGTLANYVGAPLGGMILAQQRGRGISLLILLASFVPSVINMIAYADKGTVFLTAAYFYGGVIVGRVAAGNLAILTRRTLTGAAIVSMVLIPLVATAMANRSVGSTCEDTDRSALVMKALKGTMKSAEQPFEPELDLRGGSKIVFLLRSYAVGSQFAYSDWFDSYHNFSPHQYADPHGHTWGRYTFLAIARHLDKPWANAIPPGYFGEYFKRDGVLQSNIYTFWRGLIYDFGTIGALVFMSLAGLVASLCYRQMLNIENAAVAQAFYVCVTGFIYYTSLISLFTWNSPIVAFLAMAVILKAMLLYQRLFSGAPTPSANSSGFPVG